MLDITIDLTNITLFLLLFCRVGGTMIAAPLIGSARIPARLKAGLALTISLVLAPVAGDSAPPPGAIALALSAASEIILGLAMGFGASLIFAAVQMAGEMADMQAAFGFAGVVSPQTGERNSVIGQLQVSVAWLIFLGANGHHVVLRGIGGSLAAVPLGRPTGFSAPALTQAFAGLLATSICIAAPIMAAVILTDFSLGMLTRAAPQMNLLAIGFPIKLAVGLAAALLSLPLLASDEYGLISTLDGIVRSIIAAAG
ncbi:MAG TPA: flagellar biosynthetic protein FliR [Armatimonadota bacterium]|nr:flagellar biosynthetic protein FliR [Armatimonadota bacterium]